EDGSHLVTQSGQTLEQIVHSVKKVSDIVAEIAAASREQSLGIDQVGRAIAQMDELTQQNAALVEQATAASQNMANEAGSLNSMLDHYDLTGIASVGGTAAPAVVPAREEKRPAASAPPRVERRKANRPWANRSAPKPAPAASRPEAAVASATRAPARAESSPEGNEWTE